MQQRPAVAARLRTLLSLATGAKVVVDARRQTQATATVAARTTVLCAESLLGVASFASFIKMTRAMPVKMIEGELALQSRLAQLVDVPLQRAIYEFDRDHDTTMLLKWCG